MWCVGGVPHSGSSASLATPDGVGGAHVFIVPLLLVFAPFLGSHGCCRIPPRVLAGCVCVWVCWVPPGAAVPHSFVGDGTCRPRGVAVPLT